jgi:hypothetical protein
MSYDMIFFPTPPAGLDPPGSVGAGWDAVIRCSFERRGVRADEGAILRRLAGQNAVQLIKPPETCHVFRDQVIIGKILLIQATERE